jgi:hypothetical protein
LLHVWFSPDVASVPKSKNTMILTLVGRLTQFVIMFASVKIMTTLLPPIEMGKASLLVTGIAFFAMFLVNPLGMFINRRLHAWVEMGVFRHYFHVYCSYLLVVAIIAACLAWGGTRLGLLLLNMEGGELALLVGGSLLFNTIIPQHGWPIETVRVAHYRHFGTWISSVRMVGIDLAAYS